MEGKKTIVQYRMMKLGTQQINKPLLKLWASRVLKTQFILILISF